MEVLEDVVKSCYIHIPFCNKICSYCDFCKVLYDKRFISKYLDSLEKEVNTLYKGEELETLYIGGGTPSSLSVEELEKLFIILQKFKKKKIFEFSIECNFDSINFEKLLLFKKYGVNRLSFGLESTNQEILKFLNRDFDRKHAINIVNEVRKLGFNNINIDLMYAFPRESMEMLNKDLDFILDLDVEHISTYSLIIEPHTKLFLDKVKNISTDIDFDMYKNISDKLKESGYIHYEISNFAKEGYYSRHNLAYWKNEEYYGFGVSSSSYLGNERITNSRSITSYIKGNYNFSKEVLSVDDMMSYEMILGLRTSFGVSKDEFFDKYGVTLESKFDYQDLINNKLLIEKDGKLVIPYSKWYVINSILINFLR